METPDDRRPEPGLTPSSAPADATPDAADDAALGLRAWLVQNGMILIFLAAAATLIYLRFKPDNPLAIVAVAFGLGMLIFIHELGHFLAAKWCDVHVETFSIGFGPPLPGCHFRWGETTYMIALIPLGGYVKMVGEGTDGEDGEDDPRSFKQKTVGQRMFIISAGVIMNLMLGALCFVFAYMTKGVKEMPAIVGGVNPGSPAWVKGLRTGMQITQVGGKANPLFTDMQFQVLRSSAGQAIHLQAIPYTGETAGEREDFLIEPKRVANNPLPVFGVSGSLGTPILAPTRRRPPTPYALDTAAAATTPPAMVGDRILATSDPARPGELLELPPDPRQPASKHRDMFAFQRRLHDLVGQPITLVVARDSEPEPIALTVPPAYNKSLGLRMRMGRVVAVRDKSPAVKADVRPRDPNNPDVKGDLIKTVEVQDGERIRRWVTTLSPTPPAGVDEQVLDPVKLPSELLAWSRQRPNDEVKLTVLRTEGHATDGKEVVLTLKWDDSWRYNEELPLDPASPASLPALGIAYAIESVIVDIAPDSPAAGKLNPREVITDILLYEIDRYGQEEPTRWLKLEGPDGTADRWAHVALWQLQDKESRRVKVRVSGRPDEIELTAAEDKSWPAVRRGFEFEPDVTYRKAAGVGEALWMALQKELSIAEQIYQSLKALVTGKVSPTQLHGPLSIAGTSYTIANYDLAEFVIFLGIISINLAIINFLPIPVLDGGHMVFLIYEMLTGRPPSEGVRIGATFGGLAFIVSLMLFVFGLDIARIFF